MDPAPIIGTEIADYLLQNSEYRYQRLELTSFNPPETIFVMATLQYVTKYGWNFLLEINGRQRWVTRDELVKTVVNLYETHSQLDRTSIDRIFENRRRK